MKRTALLAAAALCCMLAGAVALSLADHIPFPLALYWGVETGTTVGYGDVTPKTGAAHVIAVAVMLSTIPLLGTVFASLTAAHIHKHVGRRLDQHLEAVREHVDRALAGTAQAADDTEESMTSSTNRPLMFRAGGVSMAAAAEPEVLLADISEFQPDIADAAYLKWSKAIIIRALYGDQHDDNAWYGGQRRVALHADGVKFLGIYQFLVADQDGAAQADAFRALVGAIRSGEVFIADFEQGGKAMLTAWYNRMLKLYGPEIRPHLWTYTGLDFGAQQGVLPVEWIAAYRADEPSTPHKLWQFSGSYPVPGVGMADCSLFHGTVDELAALAYHLPVKPPPPPVDWTYGAPQNLQATSGHTSVRLTWDPPAGAPEPPACYDVFIYRGTHPDRPRQVHHYPRIGASPWQGGSLEQGKTYTAHVVAAGPGGSRVRPGCYASAVFTTG